MATGIYVIEQIGTDRVYIGSSVQTSKRWYQHRYALNHGTHHAVFLQRAWTKHGPDAFRFRVLEECSRDEMLDKEQEYLDAFRPHFNTCIKAGSPLGLKQSPETRERNRQAHLGKPFSPEHRAAISAARKASPRAAEQLLAARAARTAESHEKGHRKLRGKARPADVIEKMRAALTGRALSAEHRAKLSEVRRGEKRSETAREAIAAGNRSVNKATKLRGRARPAETRSKISQSLRASERHRAVAEARRGVPRDPAIIAKISATKRAKQLAMVAGTL